MFSVLAEGPKATGRRRHQWVHDAFTTRQEEGKRIPVAYCNFCNWAHAHHTSQMQKHLETECQSWMDQHPQHFADRNNDSDAEEPTQRRLMAPPSNKRKRVNPPAPLGPPQSTAPAWLSSHSWDELPWVRDINSAPEPSSMPNDGPPPPANSFLEYLQEHPPGVVSVIPAFHDEILLAVREYWRAKGRPFRPPPSPAQLERASGPSMPHLGSGFRSFVPRTTAQANGGPSAAGVSQNLESSPVQNG